LGFLVLMLVVGVLILSIVQDSRSRILDERLVIAEMAARQIDVVFNENFVGLEGAAGSLQDSSASSPAQSFPVQAQGLLQDVDETWLGFYLVDGSGQVVAAAPEERKSVPFAVGGALQPTFVAGQRSVSQPYVDAVSGRPAALLVVPVPNTQGDASLNLAAAIDLSRADLLGTLANAKGLGKTGHAELVDSNGLVIASTEGAPFLAPGEHRTWYLQLLGQGGEGVAPVPLEARSSTEGMNEAGTHIMAFQRLTDVPWGVAVGGSESETLAPVNDLRNEMLLVGAASLIVLWLATLVAARILVRPVRVLTSAADRMRSGDLETPIHVAEGGEIGRLGETLEGMRMRLSASLDEIKARDADLEKRVHKRTEEVQALYEELKAKEVLRSRLLDSVISAQEEERKRIARELHDETGQALTGIIMSLEAAEEALPRDPEVARQRLERAASLARQSIDLIRQLVVDLRPAALDDLGLVPALRAFAETRLGEKGVELQMEVSNMKDRLSPPVETCLFRVVQEAVTNIIRHSNAKTARIHLGRRDGVVSLSVEDDGQGFDVAEVRASPRSDRALGLAGMEERVSLVGGELTIESAPGKGTIVRAKIDVTSESSR
jgi:signal transduction histidine kinase